MIRQAISKGVPLPLEYARKFLKFIVCLNMSNSLPLSAILGDEQGHNQVTVASELRRIIQHYKEQLMVVVSVLLFKVSTCRIRARNT